MNKHIKYMAVPYYGGKYTFLDDLYSYFPNNFNHLVDLFAGSFVVSLNYKKNIIRTANDINKDIVNFFEVLRDNPKKLIKALKLSPYAQDEYIKCIKKGYKQCDEIEKARRFFVRARQSFNGIGSQHDNIKWSLGINSNNAQYWNNCIDNLYKIAEIIQANFQITNMDYIACINKFDRDDIFFYCDPPYPEDVRSNNNVYKHEFTLKDHELLAEKLNNIKGKAMVSSYESDLYNNLYNNFNKKVFKRNVHKTYHKRPNEVIYFNYDIIENKLF